jgi:hypothetical protein
MISTRCPECGKKLKAEHGQRGRRVECPGCHEKFTAGPVGWWDKVLHGDAEGARKPVDKKHAKRVALQKGKGVLRPYERIDESVIADIPHHVHPPLLLIIGIIMFIIAVALGIWLLSRGGQPEDGTPSNAANLAAKQPVKKPDKKAAPEPEPEVVLPEVIVPSSELTRYPVATAPAYAKALIGQIRATGLHPGGGFTWYRGKNYCFDVGEPPGLYIASYPDYHRVFFQIFIACKESGVDKAEALEDHRNTIGDVVELFASPGDISHVRQWLSSKLLYAGSAFDAGRDYMQERRFGARVLRIEIAELGPLGKGILTEVASEYKPLSESGDIARVRRWADLRNDLTLQEVTAFAGSGRLESRTGRGEWVCEVYVWANGGRVTFRNGRAHRWQMP